MALLRKPVKSHVVENISTVTPVDLNTVDAKNATTEASVLKVLVIEEDPAASHLLREALAEHSDFPVELVVVERLDHALDALGRDSFGAVLLDLDLPDSKGLGTLLRVRECAKSMSIIVLANDEDGQLALEAVRAGAQDYLVKAKLPGAALLRILTYALERQKFNNERESSLRQVAAAGKNLAKILDSSADGMLVIAADGIVRFANMAARSLFQCHDKPIVGSPLPVPALLQEKTEVELVCADGFGSIVETRVVKLEWNGEPACLIALRDITGRKRSQDVLQESERRLSTLMSNLPGMAFRCRNDQDWTMEFVSEGAFTLTGYRPNQLIGNAEISYASLIHPDDRQSVWNHVQAAVSDRRPFQLTYRIKTATGEERWARGLGRGVFSASGTLEALEGITTDITERKQVLEALRESEERFRSLLDHSPDVIHLKDTDGRYLLVNRQYGEVHGVSPEDVVGKTAFDVLPLDEARVHDAVEKEVVAKKESEVGEYQVTVGDGSERTLMITKFPVFNAKGDVIAVGGIDVDVTQRRRAEQAARTLSRAVEQSPVSVVITDTDGTIHYVNPKFEALTGYTAAEALGQNPRILSSGATPPEGYQDLWRTITSGRTWTGELQNKKKNGELFWEHASIGPVTDPDGQIRHFLAVKEDITERKNMEQRLAQSQKMQAVGQLTGGVAHDFNNLLTVVVGSLGLVRDNFDGDERLRKLVDNAYSAGKRGAELVNGLLAFSRIQTLRPEHLNLNETASNSVKLLGRTLGAAVEIKFVPSAGLGTIHCDPVQLQNALFNLAINARDAMPGGGTLTIETSNVTLGQAYAHAREELAPGPYVQLTVQDTGTGMPPDVIKRVFEPFFTTKEVGRGSGLGLSMVHGFVKQSGGHVEIYSEEGLGTAVKLFFPRVAGGKDTPEDAALEKLPPDGSETILVVEDDPHVRDISVTMLGDLGYQVLEAETGQGALEVLDDHSEIALVFSDVVMPGGMTGIELATRIRQRHPGMKVLLTSGYTRDAMSKHGDLDDDIELLPKPFDGLRLAHKVREVLRQTGNSP